MSDLTALAALLLLATQALCLQASRGNSAWRSRMPAWARVEPVHTRLGRRDGVPVAVLQGIGIAAPLKSRTSGFARGAWQAACSRPELAGAVVVQGEFFEVPRKS
ncbi:MAG: hypothetical protein JOY60_07260 [Burkholderiaceae bacterium]|nr:hypothetical protein [Burkholderiaceae bacterium]